MRTMDKSLPQQRYTRITHKQARGHSSTTGLRQSLGLGKMPVSHMTVKSPLTSCGPGALTKRFLQPADGISPGLSSIDNGEKP